MLLLIRSLASLAALVALAGSESQKPSTPATAAHDRPDPAVTRADLEAVVRFLASDELLGRSTGTPEAERAAAYLADLLARSGVEPAGDDGKFLQAVALHRTENKAPPELVLGTNSSGADAEVRPVAGRDFEPPSSGVDVQKLRVLVAKSAADIPKAGDAGVALFVDAFTMDAKSWLETSGHPGGAGFGLWIQGGSKTAGKERPFRAGELGPLSRDVEKVGKNGSTPVLRVRGPIQERLRKGEILTISLRSHVETVPVRAFNVVGRVRGAGLPGQPALAEEAVVVSAHYDHLPPGHPPEKDASKPGEANGKKPGEANDKSAADDVDRIYNGADDDASGCAAVLEIAGAVAAGPRPARTILFLLATGEEEGLLGTEAYLDHPIVPLERTIANLNVEMIGRPDPMIGGSGQVWLTGFDRTDLARACTKAGIPVRADPRLDQNFYERSDNYAFVVRKVIGQTFSTYNMHGDYHHPSDEADKLDYAHMEGCTKTILQAVRLVSDGKFRPKWAEEPASKPR